MVCFSKPIIQQEKKKWWLFDKKKFTEFENNTDNNNERVFIHISFDDFSSDTIVTWMYFKKWLRRKRTNLKERFQSAANLIEHLDEVPKEIIGKFNTSQAYKRAPPFAKWIIRFGLPDDHEEFNSNNEDFKEEHKGIIERQDETFEEIKSRKKIPSGIINELIAEAVLKALVNNNNEKQNINNNNNTANNNNNESNNNLYVTDVNLTNEWKHKCLQHGITNPRGDVSIFVVDKSTNHADGTPFQRIITDARYANARLQNPAQMELFTLEALLQRMATVTHDKQPVFALACDLRHWFHQIPLPRRYRRYLRIKLGDTYVYPSCWPMGFHMSPAVAQACTWTILLADLADDSEHTRRKRAALGIPQDMNFDEYVQWLPLEDGGGIFVLIDNIFIITKSEKIKNNWKTRIEQNAQDLGATLKETKQQHASTDGERIYFEEQKLINTNDSSPPTIKFSGIEFSASGRRTAEEIDKVDSLEPNNSNNKVWQGSFRDLASILGQCMWTYRVRGVRLLQLEDLLQLYSEKAFPRGDESWDSIINIRNEENNNNNNNTNNKNYFNILQQHYENCRNNRNFVPYDEVHKQETVAFIASDAAFRRETNEKAGLHQHQNHQESKREEDYIGGIILHPQDINNNLNPSKFSLIFKEEHNEDGIALAELKAVVVSIRKLIELYPQQQPDMYLIAIDSMAAKGMISRGFSRVPRARELLKELFQMIGTRKIFIMYIESEKNPADAPSRNEPWSKIFNQEQQQKWDEVLSRLDKNKIFALTRTTKSGRQVVQPQRLLTSQLPSQREREEQ